MTIKSMLLTIAMLAAPLPALAEEPAKPAWDGVWKGTIGDLPVMACFQQGGGGWATGSYYYLSQMKPIHLEHEDSGAWSEHPGRQDASTGTWQLAPQGAGLSGEWRQGEKRLPVRLERIKLANDDVWAACGADEFIAPRVRPLTITRKAESKAGIAFTRISYNPPKWFSGVSLASFEIPETRPGDRAINTRLRIDAGRKDGEFDYVSCMQGALGANGDDGDMEVAYSPDELAPGFLRVLASSGSYCGGAHPNHYYYWISFDRHSGRQIELFRWFSAKGAPKQEFSAGDASVKISPALRQTVMRRLTFADSGCRDTVGDADYWYVGLGTKGMIFSPSLPHAAMACGDDAVVPYASLAPFLSGEGKAGLARLGLAKARK